MPEAHMPADAPSDRPLNVLLITSDQQHYDTLGVTNSRIRTPALDRLAREGMRFERAYCSNPVCSPSRASIITGLYPAWHHCWTIGVKLPEDVPTVGDRFQDAGYDSVLVGKAHFQPLASALGSESIECQPVLRNMDFWREFHGPWYGFNHVETARMHGHESHVGQHYALWLEEHGLKNWRDFFQQYPRSATDKYAGKQYTHGMMTWDLPEHLHHSHWVADRSVAAIERSVRAKKPFFLWSSFFDPHPPYVVPEPWASMYKPEDMDPGTYVPGEFDAMPPHFGKTLEDSPDFSMYKEPGGSGLHGFQSHRHTDAELRASMACYCGMISLMDKAIGRILESLDRLGIAGNTLIVFSTDHGHFIGQHGLIAKGAFHYENLLRIPMLVRLPGRVPAGRVNQALQSQVDFAPTFLTACGLPVPGLMQGVNQMDVWSGGRDSARDHAIIENRHNPTTVHLRTMVTDRYKITVYRNAEYGELFDLQDDPGERRNRWDDPAFAGTKAKLMHRFVRAELEREPTRMPRIAGA
jgi:arylsulfatase A-like enzyme